MLECPKRSLTISGFVPPRSKSVERVRLDLTVAGPWEEEEAHLGAPTAHGVLALDELGDPGDEDEPPLYEETGGGGSLASSRLPRRPGAT